MNRNSLLKGGKLPFLLHSAWGPYGLGYLLLRFGPAQINLSWYNNKATSMGALSKQHFRVKDLSLISNFVLISSVVWLSKLMYLYLLISKNRITIQKFHRVATALRTCFLPLRLTYFFPHKKWLMDVCWRNCWGEKECKAISTAPPLLD